LSLGRAKSRGNSIAGQRSRTTATPFARARFAAASLDDAELHPDHGGQGIELQRLIDYAAGGVRFAEYVDHVDWDRRVDEAGGGRPRICPPA
jgi:hypothetical protein